MTQDPHAIGGHGGRFDFKGKDNTLFNIHSHTNLSVVALFSEAKYNDEAKRTVLGSYMTKAFITALTTTGAYLNISYEAGLVQPEHAKLAWVKEGKEVRTAELTDGEATEGNVQVKVVPASEGAKVSVTQLGRWAIDLSSAQYFDEARGEKRKMHRVDVNVRPLTTAVEHEAVAPHGIIGQTFDGDNLAVSGAQDDYNKSVVVTSAQGEGAIEGSWEDYIVPSAFETDFKYGRFSTKAAPARDVTKLSGKFALRTTKDAKAEMWA